MSGDDRLNEVVATVRRARKYRDVSADLVRRIGARELAAHPTVAAAVKATKGKLHQVAAAYLPAPVDYDTALTTLRHAATAGDGQALRLACREVMARHVSTRERLPVLDRFYAETLAGLAPQAVIDVACGLNPLAIPWMPLGTEPTYLAYDVYGDLADFLGRCLPLLGVAGTARCQDVAQAPPSERADVALVLKTLPCLEQQCPGAGLRLLEALDATYLLVSFPVRSIGGRGKGMRENYEATFTAMVRERPWQVTRFAFATELAFLVQKGRTADVSSA